MATPRERGSSRGTSIRIFLVAGRADGLRLVEKSNWTGIGIVCSRSEYPIARTRDEYTRPGVYVLLGPTLAGTNQSRVYVGEADELKRALLTFPWVMKNDLEASDGNLHN